MRLQVHHAKLWFAGTAENWDLSDFETKEIRESLGDIESFCADHEFNVMQVPLTPPFTNQRFEKQAP